jgi:hypothetical protein
MKVTCLFSSSLCLHGHFLLPKSETTQNRRLLKKVALGFRRPPLRWPGVANEPLAIEGVAFKTLAIEEVARETPRRQSIDSEGHFFTFSKGIYNIVRQSLLSLCI